MRLPHLRRLRDCACLTQRELAAQAGVGETTVLLAEAGKRVNASSVRKLAGALGCSVQALMGEAQG